MFAEKDMINIFLVPPSYLLSKFTMLAMDEKPLMIVPHGRVQLPAFDPASGQCYADQFFDGE
jgi:predicted deacetylase